MSRVLGLRAMRSNRIGPDVNEALDVPRVSLGRVTAISPGAGPTFPTWDQVEYDTDGMSAGAGAVTASIKANTQGLYLFTAWWTWDFAAAGYRELYFAKGNGAIYGTSVVQPFNGGVTSHSSTALIPMNYGDIVSLALLQASGGVLACTMNTNPVSTVGLPWNGFQAVLVSTIR